MRPFENTRLWEDPLINFNDFFGDSLLEGQGKIITSDEGLDLEKNLG